MNKNNVFLHQNYMFVDFNKAPLPHIVSQKQHRKAHNSNQNHTCILALCVSCEIRSAHWLTHLWCWQKKNVMPNQIQTINGANKRQATQTNKENIAILDCSWTQLKLCKQKNTN